MNKNRMKVNGKNTDPFSPMLEYARSRAVSYIDSKVICQYVGVKSPFANILIYVTKNNTVKNRIIVAFVIVRNGTCIIGNMLNCSKGLITLNISIFHPTNKSQRKGTTKRHQQNANTTQLLQNQNDVLW
jgi:hypothetical protein